MKLTRIRIAGALAGITALIASMFPTMALADVPPAQVPASLQAAIKADVEARGYEYAGLARVVNENPPLPFGKWVAFVQSIEHDIAEVTIGPVASDQIIRVNFVNQRGTWVKQGTATPTQPTTPVPTQPTTPAPTQPTTPTPPSGNPNNPGGAPATPRPPATGNDNSDGGVDNSTLLFAVIGGALAAAAAGGVLYSATRRR